MNYITALRSQICKAYVYARQSLPPLGMSQASAVCPACELETHGALEDREEVDRERVGEGHAEE